MEISVQAVAFWILYQVLGLQGFPNDDVYNDGSLNELQIIGFRSPGWKMLSHIPWEVKNINREKRFFEFNPVAFSQKPKNKLEDEERKKQLLLSPFISNLERLQTFSEQDNTPRFKSAYITNGEKPKDLKPFLDHFSGVKSFALHFKNPGRLSNADTTSSEESTKDKLRPLSGIPMRAFLVPNSYHLSQEDGQHVNDEQSLHAVHSTWTAVPRYDRKNKLQTLTDSSLDLNVFEVERPGYDQYSSNNKDDLKFSDVSHKNTKMKHKLFDVKQNDGPSISQNIHSSKTEKGNSKVGKDKVPKNFQIEKNLFDAIPSLVEEKHTITPTESSTIYPMEQVAYTSGFDQLMSNFGHNLKTDSKPHFGFDLESFDDFQTFDNGLDSFEFNTNGEGSWATANTQIVDSQLPNDFGFGGFGDVIEQHKDNKQDQTAFDGFGSVKESGSIPSFHNDEMAQDGFQVFEQGFGSFSIDNKDCEIIDTKSCKDSSECSCYGLYQCKKGKCLSSHAFASGEDLKESDFGQWHAEPVQFDSWS